MIPKCELVAKEEKGVSLKTGIIGGFVLEVRISSMEPGEIQITFGNRILEKSLIKEGTSPEMVLIVPLLGLPSSCNLAVSLNGKIGMKRIADIKIERPRLAPYEDSFRVRPLMVTSVGRSGSTFLMQLLGAHPEIAVHLKYPMEATIARKRFLHVVAQVPIIFQKYAEAKALEEDESERALENITTFVHSTALEVSRQYLALHHGQHGSEAVPQYYAEKNLAPEWLFWEVYPDAREIFLVRDPRDMICSSLAFNQKRGRLAFGRQEVETDLEYVAHRASMARPWVVEPWWIRAERCFLVHYEELITDTKEILQKIFRYLGVEATPGRVRAIIEAVQVKNDILEKHATSALPVHSIGRWRREMLPDMIDACNREFSDFLSTFNYPLE